MRNLTRFIWEAIQVIVIALILTLILRQYVIEVREIPTSSMVPTINVQERVLVDKIFYKLTGNKATKGIKRKDILVFEPPAEAFNLTGKKDDFIKRVIGLPGDTVEIKPQSGVYINGKKLDEPYIPKIIRNGIDESYGPGLNQKIFGTEGPIKVPPNSLFMMGDNRTNSSDSRVWGFASISKVKGRAIVRFWPLSRLQLLIR